jgi:ribonucleoside-diphosphate reductase alpha chain
MSWLYDVYGEEFEKVYYSYEEAGKGKKKIRRSCGRKILESQIETGTPYMLYKDAVNRKSNQKNLGTIRSSNLCTEIMGIPLLMRLLFVI